MEALDAAKGEWQNVIEHFDALSWWLAFSPFAIIGHGNPASLISRL
jgi:hypothetical protein